MEYITIGTDTIKREYMSEIIDTERIVKPKGGLWFCDYDKRLPQNCDWVNFLLDHPNVLMQKTRNKSPFSHTGAIVSVADSSKIFRLAGNEDYDKFLEFYSQDGHMSYEALSRDYDGVYLDVGHIFGKTYDERNYNLRQICVNTFLLFNIDKIESYKKTKIEITPFDYEDYSGYLPDYSIEVLPEDYKVQALSQGYNHLFNKVVEYFDKHYPSETGISHNEKVRIIYEIILSVFAKDLEALKNDEQLKEHMVADAMATKVFRRMNK